MSDPRLNYRQTSAPNFAGASQALARGNEAFNQGMDSASGILTKYVAGQESAADDAILGELAGLKNESEFDSWIDSGGLQGKGISKGMRDHLLGMRSNFIADDGTRATTSNTRAGTAIRLAAEARTSADYKDRVARTERERTAAMSTLDSIYGTTGGNGLTFTQRREGFRSNAYNDPATDSNGNQVGENVYRAGFGSDTFTTADGKVHKVTADSVVSREDAQRDYDRRMETEFIPSVKNAVGAVYDQLSPAQQEVLADLAYNYGAGAWDTSLRGVAAAVASGDIQAAGEAIRELASHNGGINAERRKEGANIFTGASNSSPASSSNQSVSELMRQAINSGATFQEAQGLFAPAITAEQGRLNAAANESRLNTLSQIVDRFDVLNLEEGLRVIQNLPNVPEAEKQILAKMLTEQDAAGTGFTAGFQPAGYEASDAIGSDEAVQSQVSGQLNQSLQANDQTRTMILADTLAATEDKTVAENLADYLGLENDPENPGFGFGLFESGFDVRNLNNYIRKIAANPENEGVTDKQIAAAMAEAFTVDPTGKNTLKNRMPEADVNRIIKERFSFTALRDGRSRITEARKEIEKSSKLVEKIKTESLRLAKASSESQKRSIQSNIDELRNELNRIDSQNVPKAFVTPDANVTANPNVDTATQESLAAAGFAPWAGNPITLNSPAPARGLNNNWTPLSQRNENVGNFIQGATFNNDGSIRR